MKLTIKISFIFLLSSLVLLNSCKKFFEKPLGATTTIDSVFSTSLKAQAAIASAYGMVNHQGLNHGWDGSNNYGINQGLIDNHSGALLAPFSWDDGYQIAVNSGMVANNGSSNANNARSDDSYPYNFTAIRQCYKVLQNIDNVTDMSPSDKTIVKAEMQTLIAYRYTQMFIIYGGVPIVEKAYGPTDLPATQRASLDTTLNFIISLCDKAAVILPHTWPAQWYGRATKSVALAIKAKALLFAARPLFNSATPYINLGDNNRLICFNKADPQRWINARDANLAVLAETQVAGIQIINTGKPLDDYGTATSTPGNKELIWVYKKQYDKWFDFSSTYLINPKGSFASYGVRLSYFYLNQYKTASGSDQAWPSSGNYPYSDYQAKMNNMEARFKASFYAFGIDAWNNPNDNNWKSTSLFGDVYNQAIAASTKFYYKAGSRTWFEFPLFRLAANYLALAESYNESGDASNALTYLNIIRTRAGLPAETEINQVKLRAIIIREWAVEMFLEQVWLQSEKHWKLPNISTEIIGGPVKTFKLNYNSSTGLASDFNSYDVIVAYNGYWNDRQFLNPFPQNEVNKGGIIQNPGY